MKRDHTGGEIQRAALGRFRRASLDEPAGVWARALGTDRTATGKAATNAVSKVFRRLEDRNLIIRSRADGGREVRITLLDPDGSGGPYDRPRARHLRLTHRYFYCFYDW